MNVIINESKVKWLIGPVRQSINDAGRERQLTKLSDEFGFGYVSLNAISDSEIDIALSQEPDVYDFAHTLTEFAKSTNKSSIFIYIEKINSSNQILVVVIKDGRVELDKLTDESEVIDTVAEYCGNIDEYSITCADFDALPSEYDVVDLDVRYTEQLSPNISSKLVPIRTAIKEIESRKPIMLYVISCLIIGIVLFFSLHEEEEKVVQVDPYESYFEAVNKDATQVKSRIQQDYNNLVAFLTFPGWNVKSVTHTNGQVSYSVYPGESGELRSLESFAKKHNFHVMVGNGEISVLDVAHKTSMFSGEPIKAEKIFNIIEVHHFLIDAFDIYLPNSKLAYVRDIPKGPTSKWSIRELHLNFVDLTKEDLITIAEISEGLPVSFGGDLGDQNIGKYDVKDELISGVLKLSIYGEK